MVLSDHLNLLENNPELKSVYENTINDIAAN